MAPHADNGYSGTAAPSGDLFAVNSANVTYTDADIKSKYTYRTSSVTQSEDGKFVVQPKETLYDFKTERKVPKTGMMLVGLGGNNGTTVTAGIIANRDKLAWQTKEGKQEANYYGSVVMGSTIKLGTNAKTGKDVNIPFNDIVPMVHPNDLVVGGWDISGMNLADAMDRAAVLEPTLKALVRDEMAKIVPMKSPYYPDFIAANQEDRANNVLEGDKASTAHVEQLRKDIR
jgi:myo-inositol-1-phosphate synthase